MSTEAPQAAASPGELPKQYRPSEHEGRVWQQWIDAGAFHADPGRVVRGEAKPYCILIPPPNVTAALHLGHALNNTLQDVLVRAHRMMGFETLWMPGTDHAGIATQAVVEKRVWKEEKKRRTDFPREEFVAKIQAYKDEYEAVIIGQLKKMGCSCDWERQRFTMDPVCVRAVREAFFRLFKDGLIYRGKRLVNWDPVLQTAVADDECYDEDVDTSFWYLRYPLVHAHGATTAKERAQGKPAPDDAVPVTWSELVSRGYPGAENHEGEEQAWVTVATTRPETYLGDTAVGVNPHDPRAKALRGLSVELPLVGRVIPIVEDGYVVLPKALARTEEEENDPKAEFATGFLKVTPAHDQNDYELGQRHNLPLVNMMSPDGRVSDKHGWDAASLPHILLGKTMSEARKLVVKEFEARGLLEAVKPYTHSVKHSDRSKAVIEPYLSDQWYVRVTDPRMAASANAALVAEQRTGVIGTEGGLEGSSKGFAGTPADNPAGTGAMSADIRAKAGTKTVFAGTSGVETGTKTVFPGTTGAKAGTKTPEAGTSGADPGLKPGAARSDSSEASGDGSMRFYPARYAKTFEHWHDNIRDWCISRQLWWGHRIPVWSKAEQGDAATLNNVHSQWCNLRGPEVVAVRCFLDGREVAESDVLTGGTLTTHVCLLRDDPRTAAAFESFGFVQDPDVLDTWFSSALWPLSTMGWPDSALAAKETGIADMPDLLRAFNPSSVLSTAREIITLWVSRMTMFNRYFTGEGNGKGQVPFKDVFIHAVIQDGEGRKMSKSLDNGVDPLDIIATHGADAMRFAMCQLSTDTQDVRLPVVKDAQGRNTSSKFDLGRNFATKLWNAAKFTMGILAAAPAPSESPSHRLTVSPSHLPDRWLLSRLASGIDACNTALANYEFSEYAQTCYTLLWNDFCDWYLEAIKPTVANDPAQRAVLRAALDTILRLLHPVMPFVTEAIYEQFSKLPGEPVAGLTLEPARKQGLLATAGWPIAAATLKDPAAEAQFAKVAGLVTAIREVRAQHNVPFKRKITLHMATADAKALGEGAALVSGLCNLEKIDPNPPAAASVPITVEAREYRLSNLADVVDTDAEKTRLARKIEDLVKSQGTLEGRLANPGYALKAPPHMVQQTRDQLEAVKAELAAARKAMEELEA